MKIFGSNGCTSKDHPAFRFHISISEEELKELSGFFWTYYETRAGKAFNIGEEYKLTGVYRQATRALELAKVSRAASDTLVKAAQDFQFFYERGIEEGKGE